MPDLGRMLIGLGAILVVAGIAVIVVSKLGLPFGLGRLPGDIFIKREGFSFYFPLTTSILISAIVSLVLYFLRR
jgi:DUF2905 family protein